MRKTAIIVFFIFYSACFLQAQEILTGLVSNPLLQGQRHGFTLKQTGADTLLLPFLDDFSINSVYPDDSLWSDRFAFINTGFGILPPTVGVATLDALDDTGAVYVSAQPTPFLADYLTSRPVRLDSLFDGSPAPLTAADSVYLSFYYQPQGTGNNPNIDDSLMLEFWSPSDSAWFKVWEAPGSNSYNFRLAMVPVTEAKYFDKGFVFRFSNYASVANSNLPSWQSNVDQWNIDYVYLDAGRSKTDTVFPDIAFVEPAPGLLKNYRFMPRSQFSNADLTDTLRLRISNLGATLNNISYKYTVTEKLSAFSYVKNGGVYDILPFITNGYHNYPLHTSPAVDFTLNFPPSEDSVIFEVTHQIGINGWPDALHNNDTIRLYQEFYNYYAYDDGTAEAGYGLAGMNSKLAYRFTLNQPDTLSAVKMFFNQTLGYPYQKYFYITVWSSLSPETVIYRSLRQRPEFSGGLNNYQVYSIADDTLLLLNGTFYIGWQQITDENLNIGFDRNSDASQHIFFNTEGSWNNTVYSGSLMMRPVFGTAWLPAKSGEPLSESEFNGSVRPNPVRGEFLYIDIPQQYLDDEIREKIQTEIFDYTGKKVSEGKFSSQIDITALSKGIYFLRVTHTGTGDHFSEKFIILR